MQGKIKLGYKMTEVGVIPEDWGCVPFDAVFRAVPSRNHQIQTSEYQNSGAYPIVDQGQTAIVGFSDRVDKVFHVPNDGVIIFGDHTCIFKYVRQDFIVGADGTQILLAKGGHSTAFHALALQHRGVESTGYNRHFKFLKQRLFQVPPLPEQRAIAEALGDADGRIAALESVIAKKRNLKQAAMQQLLTGKTRLPGFSGNWEVKRLGELGAFFKGSGVRRDQSQSGILPCVRYGEIYTTHHDVIRSFHSWISPDVAATATMLRFGDLLFAGSGETKEEIGKCVAFAFDAVAYAGGDILILRPTIGDPVFLGNLLNVPNVARQKASRAQGDAVVHISAKALASIEISMPSEDEQIAIAEILSDMDADLAALETEAAKARTIKQGMMQCLLTGKVRLV